MKTKILVAMSGGVDSSVAALLLLRQGYEVAGATFELFDGCREDNAGDARLVCERLGIRHYLLDYRAAFGEQVMDYFCRSYLSGETPNPCIACNRGIKFGAFLKDARRLGYQKISTGHYAGVRYDGAAGLYRLFCSAQPKKDQSYVLYHLTQEQLSALTLPLEPYDKTQVRRMAAEAGLSVESKSDSQDICFVPDGDYVSFIERRTGAVCAPGDYLDDAGRVIGRHRGVLHYTIGQRKGLGVSFGAHRFVSALDPKNNTVTLSDEAAVFHPGLVGKDLCMISGKESGAPFRALVKIRYSHRPAPATVIPQGEHMAQVQFDEPQRAVTKGQAAVFYNGDEVLGGVTICGAL